MTAKPYNTNRAAAVLAGTAVFFLLLLWVGYRAQQHLSSISNVTIAGAGYFTFGAFFYPALFIAEIFIYRWLRHKHIVPLYANIHLWTVVTSKVLIPLLVIVSPYLLMNYMEKNEMIVLLHSLRGIVKIAALVLLITGHIFFIWLILKRNVSAATEY